MYAVAAEWVTGVIFPLWRATIQSERQYDMFCQQTDVILNLASFGPDFHEINRRGGGFGLGKHRAADPIQRET